LSFGSVSAIVPVYRAEATLRDLYRRLTAVLSGLGKDYEILFVEDGGGDGSWRIIRELSIDDPRVRGFRMNRNFGQHNSLLLGIRQALGDIIITLDDDLQNPPEEIPKLLGRLDQGFDVVYGAPIAEQHGFLRDQASRITKISLQKAMGASTARNISAFRAFRTGLRDAFSDYSSPFVSIDVLLTWGTSSFTHLHVAHDARRVGKSGYTIYKLATHALNMLTGFTTIPLQLASFTGFAFAAFGALVLIYVLAVYFLAGGGVPGFPFLAAIVAIFSGVQLFALGIVGEYLARVHQRTMGRPPYLVRETTNETACVRELATDTETERVVPSRSGHVLGKLE
jgi:undecaprenyl-phosphate 4-deoxy-4-formamido-L-arabinose transferase